ncbi:HpcH/HpaI aldolase/citrate lyase family protein [Natrarchaeobaculum aegyptiacum]|uniref:CoA ester lyase n=1 Tax=Natrarchaeobaculum aegyptiacum TaxID=745377 RepID=A0A2Z2HX30_9EURY|nr:CoA ester lyase [Natrarchaeobaculum aegyptiacum]ARS91936.1 CoA ester lyase [Natrarchaeobaculum aegyptiacum]
MARRSVLFTPGDREDMLRKAPRAGADVIVFDLEDAVAPQRLEEARTTVREVLTDSAFDEAADCEVCVRVNAAPDAMAADVARLFADGEPRLDAVMAPKVESGETVDRLVDELEAHGGYRPIFALLETASGILGAPEVARKRATDALVFGAEDLAADLGATRTPGGEEVSYARQRVALAAAAHDCTAIDTLVTDVEDEAALRADTARSVQFGFDGKLAIHPAQVGPINEAFSPDEEDLEWAKRVLEASRDADADDRGVFVVDGEMVDAPLIAQAERLLERADAANRGDRG